MIAHGHGVYRPGGGCRACVCDGGRDQRSGIDAAAGAPDAAGGVVATRAGAVATGAIRAATRCGERKAPLRWVDPRGDARCSHPTRTPAVLCSCQAGACADASTTRRLHAYVY